MMLLDSKFNFGDTVYLKTDREQNDRIVTGIQLRPGAILYLLSGGTTETPHYDFEITGEKNIGLAITS